ncbi:hypothetical protein Zm00014a_020117 [Zea mays]|nr:hypothetical protein Zm00014a_020117 [Zea mays]
MSFQDLEAGHVRGAPPGGGRRSGRGDLAGAGAGAGASQAVASGVFQINTAVATFQRLVNTLGTPKDTPDLRDRIHKTRQHITQLVKDTSDKLKQASEADHRVEVSATKKIADAKLAKDFQAVLKEFQKAQRLAAEREAAYAPFISQAGLPQSYNSSEVNNGADRLAEQRTQLLESRRQELVFLDNEIVFNEAIIEERDQGIQEIQHQITEVNEIFKDLAVLVHDQGAMIDMLVARYFRSGPAHSDNSTCSLKAWNAAGVPKSDRELIATNSFISYFCCAARNESWYPGGDWRSACGVAVYVVMMKSDA